MKISNRPGHCLCKVYCRYKIYSRSSRKTKKKGNFESIKAKNRLAFIQNSSNSCVFNCPSFCLDGLEGWHRPKRQFDVFTKSHTCAGCAPVAGQHAGRRLSVPWGRPASCLWSPPLSAHGSGSFLPEGRSPQSGSASGCRLLPPDPSFLRHSSAGSPSPSQKLLNGEKKSKNPVKSGIIHKEIRTFCH